MEASWIDVVILTIFAFSIIMGIWRGLFAAMTGIAAIVVGFYLAKDYDHLLHPSFEQFLGDTLAVNIASKLLVFLLGFMVVNVLGFIFLKFLRKIDVGKFDRLGGALFGFIRAVLFSMLIVLSLSTIMTKTNAWKTSHAVSHTGTVVKLAINAPPLKNYKKWVTFDADNRPKIAPPAPPKQALSADDIRKQALQQTKILRGEAEEEVLEKAKSRDKELDEATEALVRQTADGQGREEVNEGAIKAYEERKKETPTARIGQWMEEVICELQEKKHCGAKK